MWNVRSFHCQLRVDGEGWLTVDGTDPERPRVFCDILKQAGISLCCISEHRWRGEGAFQLGEHLILFSGVPMSAAKAEQGVGIILNSDMQKAWRRADSFL